MYENYRYEEKQKKKKKKKKKGERTKRERRKGGGLPGKIVGVEEGLFLVSVGC